MGAFQRESRRRQFSFARLPPVPIAQPSRALVPGKTWGPPGGGAPVPGLWSSGPALELRLFFCNLVVSNGTLVQYACLENPMDGGAWWAAVHGVAKSRTRLSDFTFTFHFHALEKELATHSNVLAWKIPGTGEPAGLLSMGSHRVGHD